MGGHGEAGRAGRRGFKRDCAHSWRTLRGIRSHSGAHCSSGLQGSSGMSLRVRLIDPRSADLRPRRAAHALPTLFTAGNIFLGFYALLETFQGAMDTLQNAAGAHLHFQTAALSIGLAVFLDGLDGRIARMTNTTSDFGREMDSLADCISFGIAPAVLAFPWGIQFVLPPTDLITMEQLRDAGYFFSFVFLLCGAMRL